MKASDLGLLLFAGVFVALIIHDIKKKAWWEGRGSNPNPSDKRENPYANDKAFGDKVVFWFYVGILLLLLLVWIGVVKR